MSKITVFCKSVLGMITLLVISALSVNNASAQSFTRITSSPLVTDLGGFLGTAWGDYDGDGYVDLFVVNFQSPNMLFHNDGNGGFTRMTTGDIVTDRASSFGATWGDYDNDGDLDLFVANSGGVSFLYRNDGNNFIRILDSTIATERGNSSSASWGDYDSDGDLDLFVANNAHNNFLYQNNGNGTFTKITSGVIADDVSTSVVGLWADYDNDGDLDLYVVNGWFWLKKNFLYRNDRNGKFTKITTGAIVNDVEGSTGGSWGDYDNDGDLDLYVTNSVNNAKNSLYRNNGNGTFTKITSGAIVNDLGHSVGCSWLDYDNDGDLDLFVVNALGQRNYLYQNNGNGGFTKITAGELVNDMGWSMGCSSADYDNDGDQDIIVTNGGFAYTNINFFYQNNGNQNNWIKIQCIGTASNASAIGATVHLKAAISGIAYWQMRQISGQSAFLGQNSLNAEFGLGDAAAIDSLVIQWPSGKKQVMTNVAPNQFLKIEEASAQTFTRITSSPLVTDLGGFTGASWGDYDGDGNVDLFVANFQSPNLLFHNDGNGSFTRITTGDIVTDRAISYSATWGDYDNDGGLDLFVANRSGGNFLYHNDGAGFTRIKDGPIATDQVRANSASWGDYDNDGDLDLFVANVAAHNFLYQNNGNGTFTKITSGPIVNDRVVDSVVGLWGDYDNDGDLDLYVVNGNFSLYENFLYRNDGQGNFTKITEGAIVTDVEGSTGGSWGDYDNDGYLDLYICNSVNNAANSLYHNNGDGTFTKITSGDMVTDSGHSVGSSWVDYDNDGDLDLYVVNVFGATNQLYENNGNGGFTTITSGSIVTDPNWSFGCAWADYDHDGDQDVIVTSGGISGQFKNNFLYRNDLNKNNWISIQCKGTVSNTSAIGAVVRVKVIIAGKAVWQMQQISGQTGYLGQNSLDAEFGLGDATTIDSLVIKWPSGAVQVLTNVAPNQFLKIVEEQTTEVTEEPLNSTPAGYNLTDNYPNPFNPETTIEYELPKSGSVRLEIYNMLGQKIKTLVDQNQVAGVHQVVWNGKNELGEAVASGVYLYQMEIADFKATRRMLLIR